MLRTVIPLLAALLPALGIAEERLKIGIITHLSGPAESLGRSFRSGLELAAKDIGPEVELVFEDDEFSPANAVSAFQSLTTTGGVTVVLCSSSSPCAAVAPIAEQRKIPLIAWASDARISQNRQFVIRNYPSGMEEGRAIAQDARERGYNSAALVISQNAYAESWAGGVRATYPKHDLVLDEEAGAAEVELRTIALRIAKAAPASTGLCMDPGKNAVLALQLKLQNYRGHLFGCAYLSDPNEVNAARGALAGATYPLAKISDSFQARIAPSNVAIPIIAANGFDTLMLLHRTWKSGRMHDFQSYLQSLPEQPSASGPLRVAKVNGDVFFSFPLVVETVAGAQASLGG